MSPAKESQMEKAFWWAIGVIQVLILGLLSYLAKSNQDLQRAVVEINTTIKLAVEKDIRRNENRIDDLVHKLDQHIQSTRP